MRAPKVARSIIFRDGDPRRRATDKIHRVRRGGGRAGSRAGGRASNIGRFIIPRRRLRRRPSTKPEGRPVGRRRCRPGRAATGRINHIKPVRHGEDGWRTGNNRDRPFGPAVDNGRARCPRDRRRRCPVLFILNQSTVRPSLTPLTPVTRSISGRGTREGPVPGSGAGARQRSVVAGRWDSAGRAGRCDVSSSRDLSAPSTMITAVADADRSTA